MLLFFFFGAHTQTDVKAAVSPSPTSIHPTQVVVPLCWAKTTNQRMKERKWREAQVGSESSTKASRLKKKINIRFSLRGMVAHLSLNDLSFARVKSLVLAEQLRHALWAFNSQQREEMQACLNLNQMSLFSASSSDSSSGAASHSLTYTFSQDLQ